VQTKYFKYLMSKRSWFRGASFCCRCSNIEKDVAGVHHKNKSSTKVEKDYEQRKHEGGNLMIPVRGNSSVKVRNAIRNSCSVDESSESFNTNVRLNGRRNRMAKRVYFSDSGSTDSESDSGSDRTHQTKNTADSSTCSNRHMSRQFRGYDNNSDIDEISVFSDNIHDTSKHSFHGVGRIPENESYHSSESSATPDGNSYSYRKWDKTVGSSVDDLYSDSEEEASDCSSYYSQSASSCRSNKSNISNDDTYSYNSESTESVSSFQPISIAEFSANNKTPLELNNNEAFMCFFRSNLEKARREGHNPKNRKEILSMLLTELIKSQEN